MFLLAVTRTGDVTPRTRKIRRLNSQLIRFSRSCQLGYRVTYVWVRLCHRVIESGPELALEHAQKESVCKVREKRNKEREREDEEEEKDAAITR